MGRVWRIGDHEYLLCLGQPKKRDASLASLDNSPQGALPFGKNTLSLGWREYAGKQPSYIQTGRVRISPTFRRTPSMSKAKAGCRGAVWMSWEELGKYLRDERGPRGLDRVISKGVRKEVITSSGRDKTNRRGMRWDNRYGKSISNSDSIRSIKCKHKEEGKVDDHNEEGRA
jgi:hypothetical protein